MKKILKRYKVLVLYAFFGGCTTAINVLVYWLCCQEFHTSNVSAAVIAWILAVLFAFVTNKLFVFESRSLDFHRLRREILAFFGCRLLTGVMDVAVMYITVDVMNWEGTVWKLISNVLVTVINYVVSRWVIF